MADAPHMLTTHLFFLHLGINSADHRFLWWDLGDVGTPNSRKFSKETTNQGVDRQSGDEFILHSLSHGFAEARLEGTTYRDGLSSLVHRHPG